MTNITERGLGIGFGVMGGLLIALAGLLGLLVGAFDLATGRAAGALDAGSTAIVLFVIGGLALFFAYLGHGPWQDRSTVSGVLLIVVALLGWAVLGFADNVLALVGTLFVFLAGLLFLVGPTRSQVQRAWPA
ncbi:MAG: hypothetical protein L3K19_06125 [Thermoplasmata archaeon]|nr:hypothetical protein [Thermoplasmata archaeon]